MGLHHAIREQRTGGDAPKARILMVDDTPSNLVALEAVLAPLGQTLVRAASGREALRALLEDDFAVLLLDVQMPGMDGFEVASMIKQRERSRRTPIIFITAIHREPSKIFLGYAQGAVDYLLKPYDPEILRSKVAVFVDLWRKGEQIKMQQALLHERDRAEQGRKSEVAFRALTDAMPSCIWVTDPGGRVIHANRSWLDYSGRPATLEGFGFLDALAEDEEERVRALWSQTVGKGEPLEAELRLRSAAGVHRWHLFRALPQRDENGALTGWIGTAFDIDAQKQLEAAHAQLLQREQAARAQAEVANRAKDDFLATVSHELRTPLTAILGWTRMLRTGAVAEAGVPRALETIERNARVQAQLIEDILDVSRIVSGKMRVAPERLDLRPVVQAAIDSVNPAAQARGVELSVRLPEASVECVGDPDRLQQVLWNLLNNAVKFTQRGGRVTTQLALVQGDTSPLVEVTVTDTGAGIPPEFLPHVFERFRQADGSISRSQGGLGLGLAIVRHLVELHGGSVEAFSDGEGKGSSFVVRLPASPPAPVAETPAVEGPVEEGQVQSLARLKVLVVDDEAEARDLLVEVLRNAGAQTLTAANADEALATLVREGPDVLLSDIGLPRQDGYALIRRVRQLDSPAAAVPAAALTAFGSAEDGRLALEAGFQRHVAKPVDPSLLIAAICELTGHLGEPRERLNRGLPVAQAIA
jgi:PAS domain S-box-containing protein